MLPPADDATANEEEPWQTIGTVYSTGRHVDRDQTMQLSAVTPRSRP
jgi:hypothetical protein